MGRIAIHGFGRIGRMTLRVAIRNGLFAPGAVSDVKDVATLAALFEVDSNYGRWKGLVKATDHGLVIGGNEVRYYNTDQDLPNWGRLGIDVVIDCTGESTAREKMQLHLDKGARRVLVSASPKAPTDVDAVILPGINLHEFDPERDRIVSMASCTTNALAPVVKVLMENFGIKSGFFSTVHAYTNSQSLTDQAMADRRYSWAAAKNIIPSASGAAKALHYIWHDLNITGKAYRVPISTGSIAEVNVLVERETTADKVRTAFRQASVNLPLKGIMDVLENEWASSRVVGDLHSSIVDLPLIQVVDGVLVSVPAWYDNEMGYAARLAETAVRLAQ